MQAKPEVMEVSVLQLKNCSSIVAAQRRRRKANRGGIKLRGQIVSSGGSFRRIGVGVKCKAGEW